MSSNHDLKPQNLSVYVTHLNSDWNYQVTGIYKSYNDALDSVHNTLKKYDKTASLCIVLHQLGTEFDYGNDLSMSVHLKD